mmetsp:Transcript_30928/g.87590  ORF Transcript_30928/g.87590 Transcript_30928/m.87590 type:complete len:207 (+) Transcript_30928:275-895(+)
MRGVPFAVVGLQVGVAPCGVLEGLLQHPHRLGHVSSFPLGRQLVVKNGVRGCGHLLLHLRSAETFLGLLDAQPLHHCLVGRRAKASPNLLLHGQPLKEVLLLFEHHLAAAAPPGAITLGVALRQPVCRPLSRLPLPLPKRPVVRSDPLPGGTLSPAVALPTGLSPRDPARRSAHCQLCSGCCDLTVCALAPLKDLCSDGSSDRRRC